MADAGVAQLADVYDYVVPCFPPKFEIFKATQRLFHLQFAAMMDWLGVNADAMANADILHIVKCAWRFHSRTWACVRWAQ